MKRYNRLCDSRASWSELPIMLSIADMGKILGVGKATAYSLVNNEGIPTVKLGKRVKIPRDSLKSWIEDRVVSK